MAIHSIVRVDGNEYLAIYNNLRVLVYGRTDGITTKFLTSGRWKNGYIVDLDRSFGPLDKAVTEALEKKLIDDGMPPSKDTEK